MNDSKFIIEKNITIPIRKKGGGIAAKYPFDSMEVGDSFLVPCVKEEASSKRAAVLVSTKRVPLMSFTTRITTKGVRIWRTK